MNLDAFATIILTVLLTLGLAVWIVHSLRVQISEDGRGHRPLPRSHEAEEETRPQQLQRLS